MKRLRQNKSPLVPHSRWLAYAAAGAATTLAGAQSAEAEIHYSGLVNHPLGKGFHLIHAVVTLRNSARLIFNEDTYFLRFSVEGAAVSNAFCSYKGPRGTAYVARLSQGATISNRSFADPRYGGSFIIKSPYSGGPWLEKGLGFIGFRFDNGAGMQYGWARIGVPGPPYSIPRCLVIDYAWGDPGDQVRTGQTSLAGDQAEAVPAQGSLGLFALGAAGLMAWRKRRAKVD